MASFTNLRIEITHNGDSTYNLLNLSGTDLTTFLSNHTVSATDPNQVYVGNGQMCIVYTVTLHSRDYIQGYGWNIIQNDLFIVHVTKVGSTTILKNSTVSSINGMESYIGGTIR